MSYLLPSNILAESVSFHSCSPEQLPADTNSASFDRTEKMFKIMSRAPNNELMKGSCSHCKNIKYRDPGLKILIKSSSLPQCNATKNRPEKRLGRQLSLLP